MIHSKDFLSSISNYVSVAGSNRNRFGHQTAKADSLPFLAHGVKCNSYICHAQPLGQQLEHSKLHRKSWPPTQVLSCWSTRNCPASTSSPAKWTTLGNWHPGRISDVLQTEARLTSCSLYLQVTVSQQCYKRHGWAGSLYVKVCSSLSTPTSHFFTSQLCVYTWLFPSYLQDRFPWKPTPSFLWTHSFFVLPPHKPTSLLKMFKFAPFLWETSCFDISFLRFTHCSPSLLGDLDKVSPRESPSWIIFL